MTEDQNARYDQYRHLALGREVIRSEARALDETARTLGKDFIAAVEMIASTKGRLMTFGVGKSANVASKIAAMFSSTGMPASFMDAGEAIHGDLGALRKGDVVLCVSHSGESLELASLLTVFKKFGLPIIAITDTPGSTLVRAADIAIVPGLTAQNDPIGLAPTSSAAAATAIGDAMALAVAQHNGFTPEDFARYLPGGVLGQLMESVYESPEPAG